MNYGVRKQFLIFPIFLQIIHIILRFQYIISYKLKKNLLKIDLFSFQVFHISFQDKKTINFDISFSLEILFKI